LQGYKDVNKADNKLIKEAKANNVMPPWDATHDRKAELYPRLIKQQWPRPYVKVSIMTVIANVHMHARTHTHSAYTLCILVVVAPSFYARDASTPTTAPACDLQRIDCDAGDGGREAEKSGIGLYLPCRR
jgi:hypothetical protein